MSSLHSPKDGDVASVAIHTIDRDGALAELAGLGWAVAEQSEEPGAPSGGDSDGSSPDGFEAAAGS